MQRPGYDLFIAAPMSALGDAGYSEGRAGVLALMEQLSANHGFGPIYFAGASIAGPTSFTNEADALKRDLEALRNSRIFVLVYPSKIVTSALVEVGYALALRLPCLLLVRDKADLPYLLNQAGRNQVGDLLPPLTIDLLGEPREAAALIAAFRNQLFGTGDAHG